MVLLILDELEYIPYVTRKKWMCNLQWNYNYIKIHYIAQVMTKTVVKISKFKYFDSNLSVIFESYTTSPS